MNFDALPKISTVQVENLRVRAYIGFQEWEIDKLQDLEISFSFKYDTCRAADSDQVEDAVNYKEINKAVIALVEQQKFNLLEYAAEKIYEYIQGFHPAIQDIEVSIKKPNALRFTDNVGIKISGADRYKTAIITLGSNIQAEENFDKALSMLQGFGQIIKRTEFIKTEPLKFENQADFLNGAVLLATKKSLADLHLELKNIEAALGRVRTENKNAPRTIDLDLTTYNGFLVDRGIKELPFVVNFLKELQPEITLNGHTVQ